MATKRFKNGAWEYRVTRKDLLPKPVYLRFVDEAHGDIYVRRLEAQLDRGVIPAELMERTVDVKLLRDNVRTYIETQDASGDDLSLLAVVMSRFPADMELSALTFKWASDWVTALKRDYNLSPSTIRHHVGALARALDWIAAHGDIPFNPLRMLRKGYASYTKSDVAALDDGDEAKEDTERDRRVEPEEEPRIRTILAGGKPQGRQRPLELREAPALNLLFDMGLETAMRMREMYTLSKSQVDLRQRTIFLDKTKNGEKRQVPISSVLMNLLAEYMRDIEHDAQLFPWWNGELDRVSLRRTTSLLSRQYARIFSAAGCDDLHFHDLRHEATSRLFERTNLSDLEISKITGHKDPRVLKRYANLRGSKLAERLW